ncbi:MAG: hydrogenase subunit MbhD domain-containing protein [Acidobacteriota bacterium]|nr:hydrogenase subunit MbhD domain-containing protein [Acidobacteriota bacterium]
MIPTLDPLAVVFLTLMIICAISVLAVRDLLTSVTIFGTFSFFSATYFAILGAVDVAFTEAAVGAAITAVFFVTAIFRTDRGAD